MATRTTTSLAKFLGNVPKERSVDVYSWNKTKAAKAAKDGVYLKTAKKITGNRLLRSAVNVWKQNKPAGENPYGGPGVVFFPGIPVAELAETYLPAMRRRSNVEFTDLQDWENLRGSEDVWPVRVSMPRDSVKRLLIQYGIANTQLLGEAAANTKADQWIAAYGYTPAVLELPHSDPLRAAYDQELEDTAAQTDSHRDRNVKDDQDFLERFMLLSARLAVSGNKIEIISQDGQVLGKGRTRLVSVARKLRIRIPELLDALKEDPKDRKRLNISFLPHKNPHKFTIGSTDEEGKRSQPRTHVSLPAFSYRNEQGATVHVPAKFLWVSIPSIDSNGDSYGGIEPVKVALRDLGLDPEKDEGKQVVDATRASLRALQDKNADAAARRGAGSSGAITLYYGKNKGGAAASSTGARTSASSVTPTIDQVSEAPFVGEDFVFGEDDAGPAPASSSGGRRTGSTPPSPSSSPSAGRRTGNTPSGGRGNTPPAEIIPADEEAFDF